MITKNGLDSLVSGSMSPGLRLLLQNYEEQTGAAKGLAWVEASCRLESEVINHRGSRWN